jgi:hypothetical protein
MNARGALVPYRRRLYAAAVRRDDEQRDHADLREIDLVDGLARLLQDYALFIGRRPKAWLYEGIVARRH